MSGEEKRSKLTQPVWNGSEGLDHMRMVGRMDHPSHYAVIAWVEARYPSAYRILDCGVMSGVMYEKLCDAGSRASYVGVDVSRTVLADCASRHPKAQWILGT